MKAQWASHNDCGPCRRPVARGAISTPKPVAGVKEWLWPGPVQCPTADCFTVYPDQMRYLALAGAGGEQRRRGKVTSGQRDCSPATRCRLYGGATRSGGGGFRPGQGWGILAGQRGRHAYTLSNGIPARNACHSISPTWQRGQARTPVTSLFSTDSQLGRKLAELNIAAAVEHIGRQQALLGQQFVQGLLKRLQSCFH